MTQLTIEHVITLAVRHHEAGRQKEAEQLYRHALAQQPQSAHALHLLGILAGRVESLEAAIDLINRAIQIKPDNAEFYSNLGEFYRRTGRMGEAIAAFGKALTLSPQLVEAHNNLGIVLQTNGQWEQAIAAFGQALALNPNLAEVHYNLGNAFLAVGQMDQAIGSFRRAASLNPNLSKAHCKLGNALQSTGQIDQAIAEFRHALILNPNLVEAHNNLAIALQEDGRAGEAIAAARLAISLDPHLAEAHYNLGNALKANGQSDAAIAAYRRALALNPDLAEAHHNLGIACRSIGQIDEAIAAYRRALALNRGLAEAHNSLGLALLLQGEFLPGWDEYEWRWKMKDFPSPERNFDQAQWNGQPLEGRTLLLHAEQGIGDTLQFIRYLPPIRRLGASIIVECPSELQRLIRPIASGHRVVATGQPLPPFELHCPLMSLPRVFGTTLDSIPREIPYLHADADDIQTWKDRLGEDLPSLKVGLAWAGSPNHAEDRYRSIALDRLGPLGQVPGIRFVSLQRGHAATQTNKLPHGMQLIDISEEINDFADTAALIANLDLVIAVDTAVAHLAGAMGAPVWVLLPFAPDWRWMLDREDSPWYPTMRLFRQPLRGDWDSVVARIVCALSIWTKSHARTKSSPMSFQHCLPPEGAEVGRNQTYRGAGII